MYKKLCLLTMISLMFLSTLIIISCGKPSTIEDIYGIWKGEYLKSELLIKFSNDGTCLLSFIDNDSNSIDTLNGYFTMDFSKTPIPLSIRNIPQLNHPLHTIVEFIGLDSIMLGNFSTRWKVRPISFDQKKSIILRRLNQTEKSS